MKLPLGLILVMAGQAYADEDHSKDEDRAFLTALQKHDAKALEKMVVVPFKLENVPFKSADCKKKLGGASVVAKDAKQLVACLAQVDTGKGSYEKWNDSLDDALLCTSKAMIGGYDTSIVMMTAGGHPYHVVSLTMEKMEGEVGGVPGGYRPMCVTKADENGVEGGVVGGVVGGDINGVPPPPPPPPPPPSNVPPTMLEAFRIAGDKAIIPDAAAKAEIVALGKTKVVASFKLCLGIIGNITLVSLLKSSGSPKYDTQLSDTMKNTWKYKPYEANGKKIRVCTAITFIYGT